jgi:hypothetical protein
MTDPRIIDPGHAPTPFTAEEIRQGCPPGRKITIEHTDPDGSPETWLTVFVEADDEGALLTNQRVAGNGELLGEPSEFRATWDELQAHASFPSERTSIENETLSTPLGTLDCLRYTIDDGEKTKILWFDRSRPGLPVRTESRDANGAGLITEVVADART